MEQKTKIHAEKDRQELTVTREFELPVDLLFMAYVKPELVEQWMGNRVVKLEAKKHGSYQFEATDPKGNVHSFNGAIHDIQENAAITRTFEMENTGFPVQLEYLTFEPLSDHTSKLTMHVVYRSVADRDNILKLPFAMGVNMAHNRLEEIMNKFNQQKYGKTE